MSPQTLNSLLSRKREKICSPLYARTLWLNPALESNQIIFYSLFKRSHVCSWFALFLVLLFHKVSMNTELANTEPNTPRGSTRLYSFMLLVSNQSIYNLILLYYYLKVLFKIYFIDSLTLNSQPTAPWCIPNWSFSNIYFLVRYIIAILCLATLDRTLAPCLGAI